MMPREYIFIDLLSGSDQRGPFTRRRTEPEARWKRRANGSAEDAASLWKTQVDPLPRAAGLTRGSIMQICCARLAWPAVNWQPGDRYQCGPDLTASVYEIIDSRDECGSIGDLSGVQRLKSILTTYKICFNI